MAIYSPYRPKEETAVIAMKALLKKEHVEQTIHSANCLKCGFLYG